MVEVDVSGAPASPSPGGVTARPTLSLLALDGSPKDIFSLQTRGIGTDLGKAAVLSTADMQSVLDLINHPTSTPDEFWVMFEKMFGETNGRRKLAYNEHQLIAYSQGTIYVFVLPDGPIRVFKNIVEHTRQLNVVGKYIIISWYDTFDHRYGYDIFDTDGVKVGDGRVRERDDLFVENIMHDQRARKSRGEIQSNVFEESV